MTQSDKLLEIATNLSKNFIHDERISAIFLGGSSSRNLADSSSDIELFIIWNCKTDSEIRSSILNGVDHEILVEEDLELPAEWTTSILIASMKIDIYHWEKEELDSFYKSIMVDFSTSSSDQCSITSILDAKVIKGLDYINELKDKFSEYPTEVVIKTIKHNAFYERWGSRYVLLERGDYIALSVMMSRYLIQTLKILFALNKTFLRSTNFKWIDYQDSLLTIKPDNLAHRISNISREVSSESLEDLNKLIAEVLELVDRNYPEIDLSMELKMFNYLRNS